MVHRGTLGVLLKYPKLGSQDHVYTKPLDNNTLYGGILNHRILLLNNSEH